MKRLAMIYCLAILTLIAGIAGAQTKPKLLDITYLVDGEEVTETGNALVTVALRFDQLMDVSVQPIVQFGLNEPFSLTVPFSGQGWTSDSLRWQGFFTVWNEEPERDGLYVFKVLGAKNSASVEMDTTLSSDPEIGNSLRICRSGELALSTTSIDFDTVEVGMTSDISLEISNESCETLNVSNIAVPSPFSLVSGIANFSIPAYGSRIITIRFSPGARQEYSNSLIINSDDRRQSAHQVNLNGTGRGAKAHLPVANVNFGRVEVDSSAVRTVSVVNLADDVGELSDTLFVTSIFSNNSAFSVVPLTMTIAPGDTKSFDVTFAPNTSNVFNGTITLNHNDFRLSAPRAVTVLGDASDISPPPPLGNITVDWGSGNTGITNGAFLPLCWDNPADPSGIAEIWWKFTPTPSPPTGANDTTAAGGRLILETGANCADIRLQGRITTGFWYCYLWLVDGNGNSGYAGAVETTFFYDVRPPRTPQILGRSIPPEEWFDDETFSLTVEVPPDQLTGRRDAAEIRWKFRSPPVNGSDFNNRFFIPGAAGEEFSFNIPFNSTAYCGDDDLYIWAADSAGNASPDSVAAVPYRFDVCSPALTGFGVTWPGFPGYATGNTLRICWELPDNPELISSFVWKFTTDPAPPTSPNDTTSAGGSVTIGPGITCVDLPILGRLSTGFWYCYAWWNYANGNSGYDTAVRTTFIYDVTPPTKPLFVLRSIPLTKWFGHNANFRLRIGIPPDDIRGTLDASEVRWRYGSAPAGVEDYDARYIFPGATTDTVAFDVPFDDPSLCGFDSLYFWLADSAGNSTLDAVSIAPYRFDICAPEVVRIRDDDDNIVPIATTYHDTLIITDDIGVETARVQYRFGGAATPEPIRQLSRIPDTDRYVVEIPDAGVTRRGFEARIISSDSLDNEGITPGDLEFCEIDSAWFPFRTRVAGAGDFRIDTDGNPVPLVAGTDMANYQLFSIPYELDTSAVLTVLEDDLGTYDDEVWRLFDYKTDNDKGERFLEGANARPFNPGRSYFLLSRTPDIVVDSGAGVTVRTVCPDTIRLYEGWNLVATPFNFPVSVESLSLINSNTTISLRSYERGWNIVDVMEPWRGYALFVDGNDDNDNDDNEIYLVIQPKAAPGRLRKEDASPVTFSGNEWGVHIMADAGELRDRDNWAGFRRDATVQYDALELAEPPVIGDFVQVAFSRPEWELPVSDFSSDFRPSAQGEQVWEFDLRTTLPNTEVAVTFDFEGEVPVGVEVHLIDEAVKSAQNLRANQRYVVRSGGEGLVRRLKLIVGSHEFAAAQAGDIGLVPERFELLQNFPNPFNPQTTIRYNLSDASRVTLEVFDLLGRRVARLVDGVQQSSGYYTAAWHGRDDAGRRVASGVYIYRLTTESISLTRKMILLK